MIQETAKEQVKILAFWEKHSTEATEEACYVGSSAGWFLKRHGLKEREHKQLTGILKAQRTQEEASRKIKELTVN